MARYISVIALNMSYVTTSQKREPEVIDLRLLAKALWKRAWIIILITLLFGCVGYGYTKLFVTPTYRAYFSIYINNTTLVNINSVSSSDIAASIYLADTGADIIESNSVKKQVAEQADVDTSGLSISTSVNSDSGVLTVYVITTDALTTYECAMALVDVSSEEIARIIEGSSVQIIDSPELPTGRYQPSYSKNILYSMVLGAVLICGVIVMFELLDDRVKESDGVKKKYGLTDFGSIPDVDEVKKGGSDYYVSHG